MKIWFTGNIPENSCGGVARSMRELCSCLSMLGHDCACVYAHNPLVKRSYILFALVLCARMLFCKQSDRPDWIIARSTDGVLCALVNHFFNSKIHVALHSHGWEEKSYGVEQQLYAQNVHPKTTWKARLIRFPLLRLTLYLCDICICGTIEESRWVRQKHPRMQHKIVCIPNGVTLPSAKVPFWLCQPECPPYFITIGNLTWKKNTAYAVQLFCVIKKKHPLAKLYVIGCSSQELLKQTGVSEDGGVVAIPQVSPDEMESWYTRCPYILSCSKYEGGRSLAILESMTYGCIPFVSAIPSSMEIITDNKNGVLLSTTSIESDAAKILTAMQSVDKIMLMRQNAFLYARKQSWRRQCQRLEKHLCKTK